MSLFVRWLELECATGRPMSTILRDLNAACGTKYRHNWPSVMESRNFSLDRLPTNVRRYMMRVVLPVELEKLGVKIPPKKLDAFIASLS